MDFLTLLATFSETGFEWIGILLLVWCVVVYLPKRDKMFLDELKELRQSLTEAENEAHKDIISLINEHDKRAIECSSKIAQILQEMQSINMHLTNK